MVSGLLAAACALCWAVRKECLVRSPCPHQAVEEQVFFPPCIVRQVNYGHFEKNSLAMSELFCLVWFCFFLNGKKNGCDAPRIACYRAAQISVPGWNGSCSITVAALCCGHGSASVTKRCPVSGRWSRASARRAGFCASRSSSGTGQLCGAFPTPARGPLSCSVLTWGIMVE